jgi:3-oxoacyl-[acyl-carrier-protein] synthase III
MQPEGQPPNETDNMIFQNVAIETVACELAPHIIFSADIERQLAATMERLGMQPGLLEGLTGIRERRFWDPGVMPSEVATRAAEKALAESGISREKIGCLVNTSVCKDYIEPSVASLVHGNLGLSSPCMNYDIGNACLGFINGMINLCLMIEAGIIRYGMVVDGEGSRQAIEATIARLAQENTTEKIFRQNFATLTLGSGAVAMILCHRDNSRNGHMIDGAVTRSATQYSRLCLGQPEEMIADAHGVLVHGVELALKTWQVARRELPAWSDEELDLYAPHQVSARNMEVLNQTLGLTPEKSYLNFMTLGNIGPAAVPITLAMAAEDGLAGRGTKVGLLGIGSGLNCSMMRVSW